MADEIEILGHKIGVKGDRLNLTHMWRAAGAPSGRAPNDWLALVSTKEFVDHISAIAGIPGNSLVATKAGQKGGTSAHWQIGLAYAKYLSPAFHAACNQIVRSYIEGLETRASGTITAADMNAISRLGNMLHRTLGQRAAVQPIADLVAKIGLRVNVSVSEFHRQGELPLDQDEPVKIERPKKKDDKDV